MKQRANKSLCAGAMTTRERKGSDVQGLPREKKPKKAPDEELLRRREDSCRSCQYTT